MHAKALRQEKDWYVKKKNEENQGPWYLFREQRRQRWGTRMKGKQVRWSGSSGQARGLHFILSVVGKPGEV